MYKIKRFSAFTKIFADGASFGNIDQLIQKKNELMSGAGNLTPEFRQKSLDKINKLISSQTSSTLPAIINKPTSNVPAVPTTPQSPISSTVTNTTKKGWGTKAMDWGKGVLDKGKNAFNKMGTVGKVATVGTGLLAAGGIGYAAGSSRQKAASDTNYNKLNIDINMYKVKRFSCMEMQREFSAHKRKTNRAISEATDAAGRHAQGAANAAHDYERIVWHQNQGHKLTGKYKQIYETNKDAIDALRRGEVKSNEIGKAAKHTRAAAIATERGADKIATAAKTRSSIGTEQGLTIKNQGAFEGGLNVKAAETGAVQATGTKGVHNGNSVVETVSSENATRGKKVRRGNNKQSFDTKVLRGGKSHGKGSYRKAKVTVGTDPGNLAQVAKNAPEEIRITTSTPNKKVDVTKTGAATEINQTVTAKPKPFKNLPAVMDKPTSNVPAVVNDPIKPYGTTKKIDLSPGKSKFRRGAEEFLKKHEGALKAGGKGLLIAGTAAGVGYGAKKLYDYNKSKNSNN